MILPQNIRTLSRDLKTLSRIVRIMSRNIRTRPRNVRTRSRDSKTLPRIRRTVSRNIRTLSRTIKIMSRNIGTRPRNIRIMSGKMRNMSRNRRTLYRNILPHHPPLRRYAHVSRFFEKRVVLPFTHYPGSLLLHSSTHPRGSDTHVPCVEDAQRAPLHVFSFCSMLRLLRVWRARGVQQPCNGVAVGGEERSA